MLAGLPKSKDLLTSCGPVMATDSRDIHARIAITPAARIRNLPGFTIRDGATGNEPAPLGQRPCHFYHETQMLHHAYEHQYRTTSPSLIKNQLTEARIWQISQKKLISDVCSLEISAGGRLCPPQMSCSCVRENSPMPLRVCAGLRRFRGDTPHHLLF